MRKHIRFSMENWIKNRCTRHFNKKYPISGYKRFCFSKYWIGACICTISFDESLLEKA